MSEYFERIIFDLNKRIQELEEYKHCVKKETHAFAVRKAEEYATKYNDAADRVLDLQYQNAKLAQANRLLVEAMRLIASYKDQNNERDCPYIAAAALKEVKDA